MLIGWRPHRRSIRIGPVGRSCCTTAKESIMITPFQIPYDADQAADLRGRLARTRWADAVTDDWTMGTERGFLNQLIDFWRDGYDWAQRRDRLNQLPHVRTTVDGHGIHFLHFRRSAQ
ncbi:epoxide hydrolase N-terminal domain-containing protein [Rhizobium gallicum]